MTPSAFAPHAAPTDAAPGSPTTVRDTDILYGFFLHGLSAQRISEQLSIPASRVAEVLAWAGCLLRTAIESPAAA
ncbi:hypothetical protein V2S66_19105 [Streptomyces sp. V4-01]|uniref:Uncharacterized protein n=1 Tax=Actinacidiphila polyblastidii TaxID=3110430 RepID=A0ABU7PE32_9ACTN|nr:hypothetical protein [Streptomyces sp. V4-01]